VHPQAFTPSLGKVMSRLHLASANAAASAYRADQVITTLHDNARNMSATFSIMAYLCLHLGYFCLFDKLPIAHESLTVRYD